MAWAGTGLVWTVAGGVPTSKLFAAAGEGQEAHAGSGFSFVQISDSHIGFNKAATRTCPARCGWRWIAALPRTPDLLLHTGDITHSSKAEEFDTAQQIIKTTRAGETFYVPGEHDMGHVRRGRGHELSRAIRIRDCVEWTHSPRDAPSDKLAQRL